VSKRMTSARPYLLRAFQEWITDNGCTPYLLVNAEMEGTQVPQGHIRDGKIVLNIAPAAVRGLSIEAEGVSFSARFGGVAQEIHVPIQAVLAIYAQENGRGMVFPQEDGDDHVPPDTSGTDNGGNRRPQLRVVK
jgi:stringent starvation protein B